MLAENYYTSSSKKPVVFDKEDLQKMLKAMSDLPEPEGLVLLPNGTGFDMFKFPASLIKDALLLMQNNNVPTTRLTTGDKSKPADITPKCKPGCLSYLEDAACEDCVNGSLYRSA